MAKKLLVVAHGDLDGVISATLAAFGWQYWKEGVSSANTRVVFVQPFTVDKVEVAKDEEVIVVDVAVNNRDVKMTMNFINRLGDRLARWFDHHQGWPEGLRSDRRFRIDEEASSCAAVVSQLKPVEYPLPGDPDWDWDILVADATAADTRKGVFSTWGAQLIEQAMKADLSDDSIREKAFWWLLLDDETAREGLKAAAKKYAAIQAETERLAATYQVTGNVALVDARESNHQYDLTQLLLAGQKLAPFAVVLTVHPQLGEGLTIATSSKDVNLVELFSLGSGAPFRVSLPAKRLEEALAKLATV